MHSDIFYCSMKQKLKYSFITGSTEAHEAAGKGDVSRLKEIAHSDPESMHKPNANGWKPLHEGARKVHLNIVSLLVNKYKSNINERTQFGEGGTPLFYAEQHNDDNHPIIDVMKALGAINIGPEL